MGDIQLKAKFIVRNDLASAWKSANPVLLRGEMGLENDTFMFKFGDGTTQWNNLKYAGAGAGDLNTAIKTYINKYMFDGDVEAGGTIKPALLPKGMGGAAVFDVTRKLSGSDEAAIKAKVEELKSKTTFKQGDVFIVTVSELESKKSSIYDVTGYIVASTPSSNDGNGVWAAIKVLNGYVDADKVILKDNITLAGNYTAVGNIEKSATTFNTKGMSVAEALSEIFTKKLQPSITANPTVSGFVLSGAGAVEAGTKIGTASFGTAVLSAGAYTYGPATGVVASAWKVDRVCAVPSSGTPLSKESVATATSGTDTNDGKGFIIGDIAGENVVNSLKYKITATHGAGAVANDNLGGKSHPEIKIEAGTKSQETTAYTPYRNYFYGATDDKPELNSAYVRKLTKSNSAYAKGERTITVNPGAQRVCIACVATATGVTKVINTSALNADVTSTFVKKQVNVEGANGYSAIQYNVWVFEPAVAYGQEAVLKVTFG